MLLCSQHSDDRNWSINKLSEAVKMIEGGNDKMKSVVTNDGEEFRVQSRLLVEYSSFIRSILQDESKEQEIKLYEVDSQAFSQIHKFLMLHLDHPPPQVRRPIRAHASLPQIMGEADAQLISDLLNRQDGLSLFKKVLDATCYLEIEALRHLLMAGLTAKLISSEDREHHKSITLAPNDQHKCLQECRERLDHYISQMSRETNHEADEAGNK